MSETIIFDTVCEQLEQRTSMDRLEARGTVRIALKGAGLDPASVTRPQMTVVLDRVLPGELSTRGIDEPEAICATVRDTLPEEKGRAAESPEAVFARLGN